MKNVFILLAVLSSTLSFGQDYSDYSVDKIPDGLKTGADMIVRDYKLHFEILPSFKLRQRVYQVKTILNKSMEGESTLIVYYDQFRQVNKFSATILDKNGGVVKKLKKSDIIDVSIARNSVDDSRVKAAEMAHTEYPYTVVFEYEIEFDGLFYYPNYTPQFKERVAIQSSKFTIGFPQHLKPRYKELNIVATSVTPTSIEWKIIDLPAFEKVPYSPAITDYVPVVLTAPTAFELDGNKGDMSTWGGFASWYSKLNAGRDQLTAEEIGIAKDIIKDLNDKQDKIKAIYEYMQAKTRYVSIQLGIGGYQTMLATDVAEDGWGDCKALSNYTLALLGAVGINAYPVLIYAGGGAPNIIQEFSSNQFNHVILAVPVDQDTVWLECTSREMPYNFLGDFTDDRNGLLIAGGEEGGRIIRTPTYDVSQNHEIRKAVVTLDAEGNGIAKVNTSFSGLSFDRLIPYLDEPADKLEKAWNDKIKLRGFKIDHIAFEYDKSAGPRTVQTLDLTLKKYASKSGKRFFFVPNLMNRYRSYPKIDDDRQVDVVTRSAYLDIDSIEFKLPEGFHPEHLPEDVQLDSKFGSYSATYTMNEEGLLYVRKVERVKGRFPKESFNELSDLLKKIRKADNQKVVLIGST